MTDGDGKAVPLERTDAASKAAGAEAGWEESNLL